ncbi:MAG: cytochrome c [Deltaproteobacteria bacterium]|nr:cytochrome c [Deltaproteobacteria bacterium]
MRIIKLIGLTAVAIYLMIIPANGADHHHTAQSRASETSNGGNPLIEEMRILDGAFREIVSGVALGDNHRVHTAIESLHGSMEKTEEALHSGTVKPPKNSDKLGKFEKLDKEFHGNLESLAAAALKNDQRGMTMVTKKLLDGCVNCHKMFKK